MGGGVGTEGLRDVETWRRRKETTSKRDLREGEREVKDFRSGGDS